MPKLTQLVSVDVRVRGVEGKRRRVEIAASAHASLFKISDMLAREGAVWKLDRVLKSAVRRAIAEYITSGREYVKKIAAREKENGARAEE